MTFTRYSKILQMKAPAALSMLIICVPSVYLTRVLLMNRCHADNTATLKLKRQHRSLPCCLLTASVTPRSHWQNGLKTTDYLVGFDANGDAIQATKRLRQSVKSRLKQTRPLILKTMTSAANALLMESVEAKTKDIMPVAFEFKCVPFEGLKERPFKLRLSILYWRSSCTGSAHYSAGSSAGGNG